MQSGRILVLNPSHGTREAVERALFACAETRFCHDLAAAQGLLRDGDFDLVIVELSAERVSEARAVDAMARDESQADWLFLDQTAEQELVVRVCDAGAADCLALPLADATLARVVERVLERRGLGSENLRLKSHISVMQDCRQLVHCLEPGKLYPTALELLLQMTSRTRGLALFRREPLLQSDAVALRGFSEAETESVCRVLLEEKAVDLEIFQQIEVLDRGVLHDSLRQACGEIGQLLVVPLRGRENEAGIVCLFDEGRPFAADELERAGIVAGDAAAALGNAETYSLAKERAFIDDVTEVYNARYLLSTAENEIQRAERYGNPLSILFLDLDRFKLVNDRYGHLVGSETLRRLSKLLGQCVRQVDTLARYGGDEFTIVLVDTAHEEALSIAERIRQTIEGFVFEVGRDARLSLTISIGVSTCPEHGASRDVLLDSADKAMYRAKSEGRNRICSARNLG